MLKTRLTEEYGVDLPFVSAGMGFVALPELVAAISNAGGLGLLGVGVTPPPLLEKQIDRIRSLTPHPFGVDLIYENTAMGPASTQQHALGHGPMLRSEDDDVQLGVARQLVGPLGKRRATQDAALGRRRDGPFERTRPARHAVVAAAHPEP